MNLNTMRIQALDPTSLESFIKGAIAEAVARVHFINLGYELSGTGKEKLDQGLANISRLLEAALVSSADQFTDSFLIHYNQLLKESLSWTFDIQKWTSRFRAVTTDKSIRDAITGKESLSSFSETIYNSTCKMIKNKRAEDPSLPLCQASLHFIDTNYQAINNDNRFTELIEKVLKQVRENNENLQTMKTYEETIGKLPDYFVWACHLDRESFTPIGDAFFLEVKYRKTLDSNTDDSSSDADINIVVRDNNDTLELLPYIKNLRKITDNRGSLPHLYVYVIVGSSTDFKCYIGKIREKADSIALYEESKRVFFNPLFSHAGFGAFVKRMKPKLPRLYDTAFIDYLKNKPFAEIQSIVETELAKPEAVVLTRECDTVA